MGIFNHGILLVLIATAINVTWADDPLVIVTDPWPPYAYIENDKKIGIDIDIARAVLAKMGMKVRIDMLPWKRSLALVRDLQADAILSAALTVERQEFLYFPTEPVSTGDTVFFQHNPRNIIVKDLGDLKGLRAGALLGYEFCDELDDSALLSTASRVATLKQSFDMLINNRIDLLVEVDAVGLYKAKELGILDQVSIIKGSGYCSIGNHLAFAKKPGHELLAQRFGEALIQFKTTDEYNDILEKYGMATH